jgi:hypothetical protein
MKKKLFSLVLLALIVTTNIKSMEGTNNMTDSAAMVKINPLLFFAFFGGTASALALTGYVVKVYCSSKNASKKDEINKIAPVKTIINTQL